MVSLKAARRRRDMPAVEPNRVQAEALPGLVVIRIPGLPEQRLSPAAARTWGEGLLQLAKVAEEDGHG